MCFILRDLKCYEALPQAIEIIFEMQRKKINEKITRKKKKLCNFKRISLWTPLTFNTHNFLISYSFKTI